MKSEFYIKFVKDEKKTIYIDPLNVQLIEVERSDFYTPEGEVFKFSLILNISPQYIEGYVLPEHLRNHELWLCSQRFRSINNQDFIEIMGLKMIKTILKQSEGPKSERECS